MSKNQHFETNNAIIASAHKLTDIIEYWYQRELSIPLCQHIHMQAVHLTAHGRGFEPTPAAVAHWLTQVGELGYRAHFLPETHIQEVFQHLNSYEYQQIEDCFQGKAQPSVANVAEITNRKRHKLNLPQLSYESIWAICSYLRPKRQKQGVIPRRFLGKWTLSKERLKLPNNVTNPAADCVVYIWDDTEKHVIYFDIGQWDDQGLVPSVLFRAMALQRQIEPFTPKGHIWYLPLILEINSDLSPDATQALEELQISYSFEPTASAPVDLSWIAMIESHYLSAESFMRFQIDAHLLHTHKRSVFQAEREQRKSAQRQRGLQVDMASLYAPLRRLLPRQIVVVENGQINLNGRSFTNEEILPFWEGETVGACLSLHNYNQIWVYTDLGLLCEAYLDLSYGLLSKPRSWWSTI